jgi:hypothetical protein
MSYRVDISRAIFDDESGRAGLIVQSSYENRKFVMIVADGKGVWDFDYITLPAEMARLLGQALIDAANEATE